MLTSNSVARPDTTQLGLGIVRLSEEVLDRGKGPAHLLRRQPVPVA